MNMLAFVRPFHAKPATGDRRKDVKPTRWSLSLDGLASHLSSFALCGCQRMERDVPECHSGTKNASLESRDRSGKQATRRKATLAPTAQLV